MPNFRRPFVALTLAASLALAGCAATAGESGNSRGDDALVPVAEGTTKYPFTLTSPYGDTVLEERPERIAVIGALGDQEAVLALGITPVVGSDDANWAWLDGTAQDEIPEFIDPWADALAFETLLSAEPDLIIASTYGKLADDYERLSEIAPVLVVDPVGDFDWDWRDLTAGVAEATDLAAAGAALLDETEQHLVEASEMHPEFDGQTVSIIINRGEADGVEFVNTTGSVAEQTLETLGFAPPEHVAELSSFELGDVSLENIGLINADALLVARHGGTGTVEEATDWLEGSLLYQRLDAVQSGKVTYIDAEKDSGLLHLAWAFSYPNVLSVSWTMDELNAALDGLFKE
ncbi:MAG: ABC transporter substrate-binding protein [Leucobacter sp.]